MKIFLTLLLISFAMPICCMAQKKPAKTALDAARTAYTKGQYQLASDKLQAAEKTGKNPGYDFLYLKILIQKSLLPPATEPAFFNHMEQFDKLETLRENCRKFLDQYSENHKTRPLQKKIRQIQESLKAYPVARVQFDENMHLHKAEKTF